MFHLAVPLWQIAVRSIVIFLVLMIGLRLFGKREVGQFTVFDLVLVLLVANAVQPAMTGPDNSLTGGVVIIVALLALNLLLAQWRTRSRLGRRLLAGHPTVIAQKGRWLSAALHREGLDTDDAMMALREHGISDVSDVELAVLETDGSISVVPTGQSVLNSRHKVRYRKRS
ncbi:MAG: DUF421 domain-containing protein [Thermoleophilia bacterium]